MEEAKHLETTNNASDKIQLPSLIGTLLSVIFRKQIHYGWNRGSSSP